MKRKPRHRLTVKQYAEKKGCTVQNVYRLIRLERIKSEKIGHFNFVIEQ